MRMRRKMRLNVQDKAFVDGHISVRYRFLGLLMAVLFSWPSWLALGFCEHLGDKGKHDRCYGQQLLLRDEIKRRSIPDSGLVEESVTMTILPTTQASVSHVIGSCFNQEHQELKASSKCSHQQRLRLPS